LRLSPARGPGWRIDTDHPDDWTWPPFLTPRHRFDPLSGRFRVRYAASRAAIAARERFPSRVVTETDGDLWLIRLEGAPPSLHLTHQANLDALGVDDRINTGRLDLGRKTDPDPLLDTCGRLSDGLYDWWNGQPPSIVYRSRTTPAGRNLAFISTTQLEAVQVGPLRNATALHAHLVLHAGFIVPEEWLI
jgi:hypothetical protein